MEYQRARLEYQFKKLEQIQNGVFPEFGGNVEFELYSFFEICHHLKDWIKESPKCKNPDGVEDFVSESPALRISADICNRLKHKVLKSKKGEIIENKRSKAPLGPFNLKTETVIGPDPCMARVTLSKATIQTERGIECCFVLAQECMNEWTRYFSEN